jgi:hypothetical protein
MAYDSLTATRNPIQRSLPRIFTSYFWNSRKVYACDSQEVREMIHELKRLTVECWRSRLGRALFLIHLLIAMTLVGYVWNNVDTASPLVPLCRKLFFLLNWPSIGRLDEFYRVFGKPGPSRFHDGITVFLFSIPWWLYGYGAEIAAAKIRSFIVRS